MIEAEATAFQTAWAPSTAVAPDVDLQLKYLLVMQTEGAALQITR